MLHSHRPEREPGVEDDDEALWIVPGDDNLPEAGEGLPTVSPWRVPEFLHQSSDVRVKALLRAARGPSFLGIVDYKVLFWVLAHTGVPLLLFLLDPESLHILTASLDLLGPSSGTPSTANPYSNANSSRLPTYASNTSLPSASGLNGSGRSSAAGGRITGGISSCGVHSPLLCWERLQVAALLGLIAASLALFSSLYCSDPGWIHPGAPAVGAAAAAGHRAPCGLCGEVPSLRSHHDKHTGRCVHKHDHHCWYLAATIGDRNHSRFLFLLAVETCLLAWLLVRSLPAACRETASLWGRLLLLAPVPSGQVAGLEPAWGGSGDGVGGGGDEQVPPQEDVLPCWAVPLLRAVGLWCLTLLCGAVGALVGQLLLLHGYLAATNQTTLELLKGPRLPFLTQCYAALPALPGGLDDGPRVPTFLDRRGNVSLLRVTVQHWRGATPPRPFDEGVARNLWIFFWGSKPYPYRLRSVAGEQPQHELYVTAARRTD